MQAMTTVELWSFGPERTLNLPNRRAQIQRDAQLKALITGHRFGKAKGFTRLRTAAELAKVGRDLGHNFKPLEIEYAAARAALAIGIPVKG